MQTVTRAQGRTGEHGGRMRQYYLLTGYSKLLVDVIVIVNACLSLCLPCDRLAICVHRVYSQLSASLQSLQKSQITKVKLQN